MESIILIEPFYGGSHKQLIDLLANEFPQCKVFTQTAKKWHWRARTSALHFSLTIPKDHNLRVLFCSSVLNLAELVALRSDLRELHKVLYFHENQLVYPVRKQQDRDFQYGYNQILSCLVADEIIFNSKFNKSSFLSSIKSFFKLMPDYRPKDVECLITSKCNVLYFPIEFPNLSSFVTKQVSNTTEAGVLNIVWPHRLNCILREHDKNPEAFFNVLEQLHARKKRFNVYILGQSFSDFNGLSEKYKLSLADHIKHWGFLESKEAYYKLLSNCDVVVSTASHEFFGVAMLEAVYCGCYPLCPNMLVYPEIFPDECLYADEANLLERLEKYSEDPNLVRFEKILMDMDKYSWKNLKDSYSKLLKLD